MGQSYRFDPRLNFIPVDAVLEGTGRHTVSLRMVLDTGASLAIIPWSAAEALGYRPANSSERLQFMTGSGREAAPLLTVNAIEVLGVRIERVPVLCHDLPQGSLVDGLLGLSFLKHCRLAIDFRKGLLELERTSS